jgi:hypothetical protein
MNKTKRIGYTPTIKQRQIIESHCSAHEKDFACLVREVMQLVINGTLLDRDGKNFFHRELTK